MKVTETLKIDQDVRVAKSITLRFEVENGTDAVRFTEIGPRHAIFYDKQKPNVLYRLNHSGAEIEV